MYHSDPPADHQVDKKEWIKTGNDADDTQVAPKGILASHPLSSSRMEKTIPLGFRSGRGFPRRVSRVLSSYYERNVLGNMLVDDKAEDWTIWLIDTVGVVRYLHLANDNPVFGVGLISFCKLS